MTLPSIALSIAICAQWTGSFFLDHLTYEAMICFQSSSQRACENDLTAKMSKLFPGGYFKIKLQKTDLETKAVSRWKWLAGIELISEQKMENL
jgi:hypothetical protein